MMYDLEAWDRRLLATRGLSSAEADERVAELARLERLLANARRLRDSAELRGDWTSAARASSCARQYVEWIALELDRPGPVLRRPTDEAIYVDEAVRAINAPSRGVA
jgi:hypothetical protein